MASVLPTAGADELRGLASALAERLAPVVRPLADLAYDFHWSWMRDGSDVFREIDPHRWRLSGQNPVRFLSDLSHAAVASVEARPELAARIRALADEHEAYVAAPPRQDGSLRPVVFLCAEFGFHNSIQIYSGGLGVLAGDFLKEASDRDFPLVGIGLLYRRGYFHQRLDTSGRQQEWWAELDPETLPMALVSDADREPLRLHVTLYGKAVAFQVWRVDVGRVPLFLLDAELPENEPVQRWTTARLYDGNPTVRLAQYGLLGMGSVRLLRALELEPRVIHLNEGHPALAPLEWAAGDVERGVPLQEALAAARRRVVFTTHTPIPAGNETYPADGFLEAYGDLARRLGTDDDEFISLCRVDPGAGEPGMSALAIRMSRTRNGVSELHGAVARRMWRKMFPEADEAAVPITHVTNGAHVPSFTTRPVCELLARHLGPDWTRRVADAAMWERVHAIPNQELWAARMAAREQLVRFTLAKSQRDRLLRGEEIGYVLALRRTFSADVLTLGFARRLATYKRLYLLTHDLARVAAILGGPNPVQLLIAGKAHPQDDAGKETLQRLFRLRRRNDAVGARVSFLEDYDLEVAQQLVGGCDVWINLPRRPLEASGTSGMKAAFNGGLQLSVLDGWWAEGYDGTNGWGIPGDEDPDPDVVDERDGTRFYDLLEHEVIPEFYDRDESGVPHRWCERIKRALATCGPRFTSARMLDDYERRIYADDGSPSL